MAVPDRIEQLLAQSAVTGIDFLFVDPSQTVIDVFFILDPAAVIPSLPGTIPAARIRISSPTGGERLPEVAVAAVAWIVSGARNVLRITTVTPGDFSRYKLFIDDPRIDPFFNDVFFSFKANCPTE